MNPTTSNKPNPPLSSWTGSASIRGSTLILGWKFMVGPLHMQGGHSTLGFSSGWIVWIGCGIFSGWIFCDGWGIFSVWIWYGE